MRTICRFSVLFAIALAASLLPVSCAGNRGREPEPSGGTGKEPGAGGADEIGRQPLGRSSGKPEYTSNTLLMSLNDGFYEEDVYALASKYDMEILYLYQNFNMCAAKLPRDYSDAEFKVLFKQLEKEPIVLSAERDGIMYLYDSGPGPK